VENYNFSLYIRDRLSPVFSYTWQLSKPLSARGTYRGSKIGESPPGLAYSTGLVSQQNNELSPYNQNVHGARAKRKTPKESAIQVLGYAD
jgi:hypothetical protein